ncbi:EF-hand domain-containing protein [Opitutales bacterium]|nr:EF-hand domain-containing protein [Opitutales bacterium]
MHSILRIRTVLLLLCLSIPAVVFGQVPTEDTRLLTGSLLDRATIKPGEMVPGDLKVYTEAGEEKTLLEVIRGNHTVLVSGCLTCPIFHRTYPGVEAVYQDYKDVDDVQFFYLYKTLAHPEYQGYVQPATLEERLAHIPEVKRVLDTSLAWLCDSMDNAIRHTLGLGPNSQIIFNPAGEIVHALGWSDGDVLRRELVKLIGDTDTHTTVADLNLDRQKSAMDEKTVQKGKLESPSFSEPLVPLQITAKGDSKQPLYVKPRVEVTQGVLQRGRGEMYLGFHLDPIHHVHWNNLAAPLQYELKLPEGVYMSPRRGAAEEVAVESDADPREFVIEVTSSIPGEKFDLSFHYFACSDEEGWCVPVTQTYEVTLTADQDGGSTMGRSFNRGGGRQNNQAGRGQGRAPGGRQPMNAAQLKERILQADADGDGKISESEAPQQMANQFQRVDQDSDGFLDEAEIDTFVSRSRPGGQGGQGGQRPATAGQGGRGNPVAQLRNMDSNGDGKITRDEMPEQWQQRFDRMDANGDEVIDEEEIEAMGNRGRGGQGSQRGRGGR